MNKLEKMAEQIRIPNIENYIQEIINGELILTPKKNYKTENEINMIDFTKSIIQECVIKNQEEILSNKNKYRSVLVDIWKYMPAQQILQTTTFNFKLTDEGGVKGYHWNKDLNMSFQDKNAKGELKEIIHMCKVNRLSIKLSIKLATEEIIHFKID